MAKESLEILRWVILKCAYCNREHTGEEYHWQYHMGDHKLQAICPSCEKTNIIQINLNKN